MEGEIMKPINCPACGARMKLRMHESGRLLYYDCFRCDIRGPRSGGKTHRGAAIKAGRAMRRIVEAIETQAAKRTPRAHEWVGAYYE